METRKLSDLKPYSQNPRNISESAFERLKGQLALGQHTTLLVTPDGIVLSGNMRLRAMTDLGIKEVKVLVLDYVTKDGAVYPVLEGVEVNKPFQSVEDMHMAYSLSANDTAGFYDQDMLVNLMDNFAIDWNAYAVNFTEDKTIKDQLEAMVAGMDKEVEEDEAPSVSEEPAKSEVGKIYQLGRHRLMCGDSTDAGSVALLMNGQKADMVFTDPPYGVSFQSNMREKSDKFEVLKNDDKILTEWIPNAVRESTGWILICTTWKVLRDWFEATNEIGKLSNMIIWDKGGGGIGDLDHSLSTDYEIILAFNRGNTIKGKRLGSVWGVGKDHAGSYQHPTQKPVGLSALAIKTLSSGDVLDLFGGSGSTLIACEQLDRTCYMMELDPKYCDVIRKRYAQFVKAPDWEAATPAL